MTPEKEKNLGPDSTAVALEEEKAGETAVDGTTGGPAASEDTGGTGAQAGDGTPPETPPAGAAGPDSVKKAEFQEVVSTPAAEKTANLDLLLDVVVPVTVELGRAALTVKDILSTCQGSVIELDRAAGEPVEILAGGKPLARGEVVVVKDRFGVRITELIGPVESVAKV
jgi:flagellar motor switch protein FliN/FliY